jgi:hypothetical protein
VRIGAVAMFHAYTDVQVSVPRVFARGDLIVISRVEGEGAFRAHALSATGKIARWRSDLVFSEEVELLNDVPLITEAGELA